MTYFIIYRNLCVYLRTGDRNGRTFYSFSRRLYYYYYYCCCCNNINVYIYLYTSVYRCYHIIVTTTTTTVARHRHYIIPPRTLYVHAVCGVIIILFVFYLLLLLFFMSVKKLALFVHAHHGTTFTYENPYVLRYASRFYI